MSSLQLVELINSLNLECKTQVACKRTRIKLLAIKKLTDVLRKEYLAKSVALKQSSKRVKKVPKPVELQLTTEPDLEAKFPEQM